MTYLDGCKEAHDFPKFFQPKNNKGILGIQRLQNGDFQKKVITQSGGTDL